jgi:hypothetical protein
MRRITKYASSLIRKGRDADEGATLVFVAVSLVALLALSAFAIDFGRMYEERRQLQNGADAAAVAIAEDCARGLCDGSYDEYATAEIYVDQNARDGAANAWLVDLDLGEQTVTVHNRTEDPGGDNKFDMLFASVVGFDGFTVGAEATVAWGGLVSQPATIPIIISDCEWDRPYWEGGAGGMHSTGPHLFPEPVNGDLDLGPEYPDWSDPTDWSANGWDLDEDGVADPAPLSVILTFHDGGTTDPCAAQAGQDTNGDGSLSGGFGWLDIDGAPCEAWIAVDEDGNEWSGEDPGASPSTGCDKDTLTGLLFDGIDGSGVVWVPYFEDENGLNGSNGEYKIAGAGAFFVTGYNFGGQYTGIRPGYETDIPCRPGGRRPLGWTSGNDDRCLAGFFVEDYGSTGEIDPNADGRGITVIKFTS